MWWYNNNTSQRKLGSFALYGSPTSYALFNDGDFSYCNSNDCNNNRCMRNKKNRWFNLAMNNAVGKGKTLFLANQNMMIFVVLKTTIQMHHTKQDKI